jgi:indolepyruvate ferredoxin oxidoreductase beta subunit
MAADAGRVVKGYVRVRRDAFGDFWAYLDEALPRIAQTAKTDQAIDDLGGRALKVIAKEAGSQAALRAFLDAELPQSVA